jgi:carbonic anhydrase
MGDCKKLDKEISKGNDKHVERLKKCHHKHQPEEAKRHGIILTCMDARIDPLAFVGFEVDEVYVLRNGGGRVTSDMVRSAVLAIRLFAADSVFIIHHTDCGLEKVDDPHVRELLRESLGPAKLGDHEKEKHNRDKNRNADYVAFLAFENLDQSVINDVARLRQEPLISKQVNILGYVLDIDTGKLKLVDVSPGEKP